MSRGIDELRAGWEAASERVRKERGESRWSQKRGWADLIYLQGLWLLRSDHSDRQKGFGRLIKIIISYPSHITLADGMHVVALLSSSCQRCHWIRDNSWWSIEEKCSDFEAMAQLYSPSFTLNLLLALVFTVWKGPALKYSITELLMHPQFKCISVSLHARLEVPLMFNS